MKRTRKRMGLCIALLIALHLFIWGNSLLPGEVSGAFSNWVQGILSRLFGESQPRQGSGLLRKLAHFSEFAALGACLLWLVSMLGKRWSWALLWGFAAACTDETIQRFVPGRGPALLDVGIDTCGVLAGIGALLFGHFLFIRKKNQLSLEDM